MPRQYFVYIMASWSRALYTGVTNDLVRRVLDHREPRSGDAHTAQYRIRRLVYYDFTSDVHAAIAREKEVKSWRRVKRVALIEEVNPGWIDLAARWPEIAPLPREPTWRRRRRRAR